MFKGKPGTFWHIVSSGENEEERLPDLRRYERVAWPAHILDYCKKNCDNVFRVSDPYQFDYDKVKNYKKVGIVLGASTPIEQFQEVISNMEKVTEEIITNETVETAEEVKAVIQEKFAEVVATKNKGMIMKNVMAELKGKADGKVINQVVAELCQ